MSEKEKNAYTLIDIKDIIIDIVMSRFTDENQVEINKLPFQSAVFILQLIRYIMNYILTKLMLEIFT